jgi:hypothetical protein
VLVLICYQQFLRFDKWEAHLNKNVTIIISKMMKQEELATGYLNYLIFYLGDEASGSYHDMRN